MLYLLTVVISMKQRDIEIIGNFLFHARRWSAMGDQSVNTDRDTVAWCVCIDNTSLSLACYYVVYLSDNIV